MYLLGLFSWVLIGLVAGFLAARFLPGQPPMGGWQAAVVGSWCALAGGFLATGLGFGGLAGYDVRSLTTAVLASTIGLLILRIRKIKI